MRIALLAVAALALAAVSAPADDLPPSDAVEAVEVVRTGDYSEGVVVDHEGNLYFSHGRVITKTTPDGSEVSTWAETGEPNGHKILADGTHLVCDPGRHVVLRLDAGGRELGTAAGESDGQPLEAPNDLTLDPPNGGFYLTDPGAWDPNNYEGKVHYVDADGRARVIATGLGYPNGIVLRPDGNELLVGESFRNRIMAYPVLGPGRLGEGRVFVELPEKVPGQSDNQPDGLALDTLGNLYVAHYGMGQVQVISPSGEVIRRYPGGNLTTSNVAFAGPDMDQLFVTGGEPGALYRIDLGVRGLTILPPRSGKPREGSTR
ncbi:SMP-30/gluconolactonase/LRE family protein [Tautonia plasticadhaerens]|uniref:Gluconolactonase n=1 Tax=Tautonia plasticadhaerens TaxID=2527974 RepID=A0A518H1F1_9BACT|nr:SMP-30/gluconolactonase/LRE family protein [Tautonia plasticadhaerens]QDV34662.1 Gluconolactonase precursor [Tautonia plasticadhaerens]